MKLAKGNSGHRPIGVEPSKEEQAANAAASRVDAPAWLLADGLDVWKRLAPRLIGQKLLFQIDAETFGRYCKNFARWLKMQGRLDDMGEIYEIETASGKVRRADPAYLIADRLERQLTAAEASFGLNPAERQRIFVARAAALAGGSGDLFGNPAPQPGAPQVKGRKAGTEAPPPAAAKKPGSAVGFLQ